MPTPSIVIVPARLKAATLFSQLPLTGEADLSLVQASGNATRVNASGFIEVPRTNLSRYSEQFDTVTSGWTAVWLQTITVNTTATLDPAGGNTADLIVATTGSVDHHLLNAANNYPAFVSGTTYTFSVFAKATNATNGFVQLLFGAINFLPSGPFANFQLSGNGAITTGTYSAASIQSFGNGWYRCSITATAAANGNATNFILPILASGTTRAAIFSGNGVDGVYIWGAQLEIGNTATTYIPTTSSIRTLFAGVAQDGALSPNVPRLDYRNLVGAVDCPALLVEPSATNLMIQSQNLSLAFSSQANTSVSADVSISPDGTQNADRLTFTTTGGYRLRNFSIVSGTSYTATLFYKNVDFTTGNIFSFQVSDGIVAAMRVNIDPVTNTITQAAGPFTNVSSSIENYGNGWYRVRLSGTASNAGGGWYELVTNATKSIDLWGFQFETGLFATSYIPTTTASATRGADNYSVSGAVSGFIGLTSGAIYAEVDVRNWEASGRVVALSDGTSDGSIVIMENANRSFSLSVTSAGFSTVSITTASGLYNGLHRIAVAYKKDDYAVYLNGQLVGTNTTAGVPSVNRIFIGKIESSGTTNYFNDRIRAIAFYNTRPTNSELATLTQVDYTNLVWDTYTSRTSISTELPECLFVRHIELLNI